MRLVPIECIREGCFLAKTIYDDNGIVLLRKGVELTNPLITKLKKLNLYYIYIIDEYSDKEIEDIIKPELRQKSIQLVKDVFSNVERLNVTLNHLSKKSNSTSSYILKENSDYLKSLSTLAEELLENILSNKNIMVNLVDIKTMDNYTYQHSVNVAILSIVLGVGLKLSKDELISLSIGALLHDIGKTFIDRDILLKPDRLTFEEFEQIKNHPRLGYNYVLDSESLTPNSKLVVLHHHEKIDGSGYPANLLGHQINYFAKIVAIADVYDALTSNRPYKKAMCPNEAFEYILANAGKMFDFSMVQTFAKIVIPYPEGTIVKLSNGDVGVVENLHPIYPLRPAIKILKSQAEGHIGSIVDLSTELSLVISAVETKV